MDSSTTQAIIDNAPAWADTIGNMQIAVYAMVGGGLLGRSAAEQPADFYIDGRVGKLPYTRRHIIGAVERLALIAQANGLNPHDMPSMPRLHNLGVF